jgi:hypothetical protein
MNRYSKLWLAGVLFSTFIILSASSSAQNTQDFVIQSFSADYYLDRNDAKTSLLHTVEDIQAQFPNYDQNHGILRAIPEIYQGHTINLKVNSVTDQSNQPLHYTTYHENDNLVLKIGDADKYVHGLQIYKISYDSRNVVNLQTNQDQFFWNVNGNQWSQPFTYVTARLHLPSQLAGSLYEKNDCYVGYYYSQDTSRCVADDNILSSGDRLLSFNAASLQAGETMSFKVRFDKGTFAIGPEVAHERQMKHVANVSALILGAALPAIAFSVMINRWRKFGNDPKGRGVIIPQYEPPKGLTVMYSDFLLKEELRGKALSASLIDLAVHKHLTISEIPKKGIFGSKDYELKITELPADLNEHTKKALSIIFDGLLNDGSAVKLSEFKNRSSVDTTIYKDLKDLEKDEAGRLYSLGYFVKDPLKIKKGYQIWAIFPFLLGFGTLWAVLASFESIKPWGAVFAGLGLGLIFVTLVMYFLSFIMPARSLSGVEARDELLGLKDYIKLAEADRLKYLQSPEGAEKIVDKSAFNPEDKVMKVKLFEELLPYAILFGLEEQWAKQFKDIYTKPPDWYNGNWSTFNAVYLANSVGGFSSTNALSFSSPSSGGGGGGAGGGGGGGGGGW